MDEAPAINWGLGAYSQYIERGIDLSSGQPTVFGWLTASQSDWYVELWAATVDFTDFGDPETQWEAAVTVGRSTVVGAWTADVGMSHVVYGSGLEPDASLTEAYITVGRPLGEVEIEVSAYISPDYAGEGFAMYESVELSYAFSDQWELYAQAGYQHVGEGLDYATWSTGLQMSDPNWTVRLSYSDTDRDEAGRPYAPGLSLRVDRSF